jgi:beta-galactosidase/beta-glucuronidase
MANQPALFIRVASIVSSTTSHAPEVREPNLLEVTVSKVSANLDNRAERSGVDYWVFGGIFRPVYLEALPAQFIDWTAIDARRR